MPTMTQKNVSIGSECPAKDRQNRRSVGTRRSFLSSISFPPSRMTAMNVEKNRTLTDELSFPILLAERIHSSAAEVESFKSECNELASRVGNLSKMLKSTIRLVSSTPPQALYDRPIRRIVADVSKNIERALDLVRICKRKPILSHLFTTSADFKRLASLLEYSISDMRWLISVFEGKQPIDSTVSPTPWSDSNLPTVWCLIATLQMGSQLHHRIEALNRLTSLAKDSEQNRKIIVQEGAVQPLLRFLKNGGSTTDGQIAAANALLSLVDYVEMTRVVSAVLGVPLIVQVLKHSSRKVQIAVADLVAKMVEVDDKAKNEFGEENVLKPLVSCLMMDLAPDYLNQAQGGGNTGVNNATFRIQSDSFCFKFTANTITDKKYEIDGEDEQPDVKHMLKKSCAVALWRLCEGSLLNSQKISEGNGLLLLSKIIETEGGEVQLNCLMTVMEITKIAESNSDLRKIAWKPSAAPTKAIIEQLLRVVREETDPRYQIPAIKALGYLARNFSAKETRIISPLVAQLASINESVVAEAAIALGKFVRPDNFNCKEHSKAIIECNGIPRIKKMTRYNELCRMHGVILLCCLSLHAENTKPLEDEGAFEIISAAARITLVQHPYLKQLLFRTTQKLKLYHPGAHIHTNSVV